MRVSILKKLKNADVTANTTNMPAILCYKIEKRILDQSSWLTTTNVNKII